MMMEVDQISYIFGSFSRRRQSQEVSAAKRRSIEPAKIAHQRSKSSPQTPTKRDEASPRTRSVCDVAEDDDRYKCPLCRGHFMDPRVLPCLHTFCKKCLQELECKDVIWNNDGSDASSGSANGSGGSGYVSDKLETSDSSDWSPSVRTITCPTCQSKTDLTSSGVSALPPNYLIQHRLVLATLNAHTTKLLCDLCPSDVPATFRCPECAVSLCPMCGEVHRRQKSTGQHQVLTLEEARRRGITKVRRQVMCVAHPERELTTFCSTCYQVVCRDCVSSDHRNHSVEAASRAAKSHTTNIRIAVDRAKSCTDRSSAAAARLDATSKRVEQQCDHIQQEIEKFTESYVRAVEEHQRNLYKELSQARDDKLQVLDGHRGDLRKRLKDTKDAVCFADELLREGTDVEVLSFVKPIMRKLEMCYKLDGVQDLRVSESLQFLPEELARNEDTCCPLYGVITTQTISMKHCVLHTEGLQNLRVGRRAEIILETRDRTDQPLQRGGEQVTADLRHRDAGESRSLQVKVEDRRDGTYRIYFIPDVAGKLMLSIFIKGQPIKESPMTINVRTLRPHHGTFHCCSFCSSGGSKEAACGCGGKMPGGYKGCGHGHDGHPGRRHWSCCGNILEHSECVRTNSITHYQFTL